MKCINMLFEQINFPVNNEKKNELELDLKAYNLCFQKMTIFIKMLKNIFFSAK